MTQLRIALMAVLFLTAGFLSCGQNKEKSSAGDATTVPGKVQESADFKILVPEGWTFTDFKNGAIQTYNKMGTYMVEVKKAGYNMTEKDVESTLQSLANQYKGTPLEKVEMLGLKFYKTTYTFGSTRQTMYTALRKGEKISIGLMGPDHEKDKTIQAVFRSITLK